MVSKKSELLELKTWTWRDRRALRGALSVGQSVRFRSAPRLLASMDAPSISPLLEVTPTGDSKLDELWQHWQAPKARCEGGPAVTVVIPSHRRIPVGLTAWSHQDLPVRVLVLSNGPSGPGEVPPPAEVHRVPWEGHGRTRQSALSLIDDPYVLFTVDDALPLGAGMLRALVEVLEDGSGWDAVIARQVPWPDASSVTRQRLRRWTPPEPHPYRVEQTDHVATLYRTEDLRRRPLPGVSIAEDAWWSRGCRIACVPGAPVLHSHRRRPWALYRRTRDIHRELVRMGKPPTVAKFRHVLGAVPSTLRMGLRVHPLEGLNQLAELAGQYRGSLLGRESVRERTG